MCCEDRSEVSAVWQELRLVTNEGEIMKVLMFFQFKSQTLVYATLGTLANSR